MATFPRGHHSRHLKRPSFDPTDPTTTTIHIGRITTTTYDPSDTRTLRGIPAIGRGVAGVSPGTRPDHITTRDEPEAA